MTALVKYARFSGDVGVMLATIPLPEMFSTLVAYNALAPSGSGNSPKTGPCALGSIGLGAMARFQRLDFRDQLLRVLAVEAKSVAAFVHRHRNYVRVGCGRTFYRRGRLDDLRGFRLRARDREERAAAPNCEEDGTAEKACGPL
jgi:hypothetical protein